MPQRSLPPARVGLGRPVRAPALAAPTPRSADADHPFTLTGTVPPADAVARAAAAFLGAHDERTRQTYRQRLRVFADWLGVELGELPATLLTRGPARVTLDVEQFRAHLKATLRPRATHGRGRADRPAPATVNAYLAAIRSLVGFLARAQLSSWTIAVADEPAEGYRDTAGPGLDAVRRILAAAAAAPDPRVAVRDVALIRVLFDLGLRRAEALGLALADVRPGPTGAPAAIWILGKGRKETQQLALPARTADALDAWLTVRRALDAAPITGRDTRPLFVSLDRGAGRAGRGARPRGAATRLTAQALAGRLAALGDRAGVGPVRPHGLRHTAITAVLDAGASTRDAQRFSRHRNAATLQRYDDNRTDIGGRLAARLSEQL